MVHRIFESSQKMTVLFVRWRVSECNFDGCTGFFQLVGNVFVYGLLRGLARNLANKNQIENPQGFS